jgi:hypothetical protein
MSESTFINDKFTNRLFHGQVKIGICFHYFSTTLSKVDSELETTVFRKIAHGPS